MQYSTAVCPPCWWLWLTLDHEVLDDPVEAAALEAKALLASAQRPEVLQHNTTMIFDNNICQVTVRSLYRVVCPAKTTPWVAKLQLEGSVVALSSQQGPKVLQHVSGAACLVVVTTCSNGSPQKRCMHCLAPEYLPQQVSVPHVYKHHRS